MGRDVAYDIVAHAVRARFSDLPERTVRIAKKFILDTLGVAIAGSAFLTVRGSPPTFMKLGKAGIDYFPVRAQSS